MSGSDISLGDLFRAVHALAGSDPDVALAIARLLRLEAHEADAVPGAAGGGVYRAEAGNDQMGDHWLSGRREAKMAPHTPPSGEWPGDGLGARLEVLDTSPVPRTLPAWVESAEPMAPARELDRPPPRVEPLLAPRQSRGIVAAALATRVAEGPLDVGAILERLARLEPVDALPRLPLATLRRGVQLLLDRSAAMQPYAADRDELAARIGAVAGTSGVQTRHFFGAPVRGVYLPGGEQPVPWTPPAPATPVVLVSTFGIGGPMLDPERSTRHEWLALARVCRARGCPVVAFVPFAPRRWDRAVAREITMIHWDRPTTVGAVRRAAGRGHEVMR